MLIGSSLHENLTDMFQSILSSNTQFVLIAICICIYFICSIINNSPLIFLLFVNSYILYLL